MAPEGRRRASTALAAAAALLLVAATVTAYVERMVFDADRFSRASAAALGDADVRAVVGEKVTDELILRGAPDLVAARPIIAATVGGIVGSEPFTELFRLAARDAHRAALDRDEDTVALTLVDVGTVAGAALRKLQPELAAELERSGEVVLAQRRIGAVTADLARTADRVRALAALLAALTIAAAGAALALSGDRRRTVAQLGLGMIGAGVVIVLGWTVAREALASGAEPESRDAARAVWDAIAGDLRAAGLVLTGAGAVVAAAATSLLPTGAFEGWTRRAWRVVTAEPRRPRRQALRAVALVVAGVLLVTAPLVVVQAAATALGVLALLEGAGVLLRLAGAGPRPEPERPARRRRAATVGALAAALVAVGVALFAAAGGVREPALVSVDGCNGHAALCERRLDEVVLATTHNSMSAPLRGWLSSLQERSIGGQLQVGIRGLQIDTYYADRLENGRVRTDLAAGAPKVDGVSRQSADAAKRLRERAGFRGEGERGLYLCHTFCEIGATPLADGLGDIHDFLVTHPGEVVVVINQDAVSPEDFVAAVEEAGLDRYAAALDPARLPTLGEMVESGRRLVLLAENRGGGAPWYQPAYERLVQETPYHFGTAGELIGEPGLEAGCRPNRGPDGAPLMLLNHWVTTDPLPLPSDAATVNAFEPLIRRARTCRRVRGRLPNLVAVNFFEQGDTFGVVDRLNGVTR